MRSFLFLAFALFSLSIISASIGCQQRGTESFDGGTIRETWEEPGFSRGPVLQFEGVVYGDDSGHPLRGFLRDELKASGRRMLDLDAGTGVLGILADLNDATEVIATASDRTSLRCIRYNAAQQRVSENHHAVLAEQNPWDLPAQIQPFDLIVADLAMTEPDRLAAIFDGLADHLQPSGRAVFAVGPRRELSFWEELATANGLQTRWAIDQETEFQRERLLEVRRR